MPSYEKVMLLGFLFVVAGEGIEPSSMAYETIVLPLDYPASILPVFILFSWVSSNIRSRRSWQPKDLTVFSPTYPAFC